MDDGKDGDPWEIKMGDQEGRPRLLLYLHRDYEVNRNIRLSLLSTP